MQRGHTARSKTLLLRLTATEKAEAQRVAEELGLTQQDLFVLQSFGLGLESGMARSLD